MPSGDMEFLERLERVAAARYVYKPPELKAYKRWVEAMAEEEARLEEPTVERPPELPRFTYAGTEFVMDETIPPGTAEIRGKNVVRITNLGGESLILPTPKTIEQWVEQQEAIAAHILAQGDDYVASRMAILRETAIGKATTEHRERIDHAAYRKFIGPDIAAITRDVARGS